ncbi:MAG: hypothetical protein LW724_16985 [Planctomycetaceae bacterium]|nr:hypothetical protein [Planctomycetaceae bacterium]
MTERFAPVPNSNPFSCRYFEPGMIPFLFHDEHCLETLADRFRPPGNQKSVGRWAIVGPHGSGKSTLLTQLSQRLNCHLNVLHSSTQKLVGLRTILRKINQSDLCFIDGYEQLPRWAQLWLLAYTQIKRVPMCVTAHRLPWAFESLWQTRIDHQVEHHVLDCLLRDLDPSLKSALIESQAWKISREKQRENLRESLFDMYDWWRDTVDEYSRAR